MRYLITGATGFIGKELISQIRKNGDSFDVITRNAKRAKEIFPDANKIHQVDLKKQVPQEDIFKDVDVVINLAGEFVFSLFGWTKSKKLSIYNSRVVLTRNLVKGVVSSGNSTVGIVSASAVGYYPQTEEKKILDEKSENGTQFLSGVCFDWENEAISATKLGIDVSIVRLGIVLGRQGGVIASLYWPFVLGLGTVFGRGTQWWSWIHVSDVVNLILFCAENRLNGIYNGVSVDPVMHKDFALTLAKSLNRGLYFKFPEFLLKLFMREMSSELLNSYFVKPHAILSAGFRFRFDNLNEALKNIFSRNVK